MKTEYFMQFIVEPAMILMEDVARIPASDEAAVMLMAIAGQESAWAHRVQVGGPARSYWQFEGRYGGVGEVFAKTPNQLRAVCGELDFEYTIDVVFAAMAWNDLLGCAMARLLLWQDPAKLPALGEVDVAWEYYRRNWRPGAPHPESWSARYAEAMRLLG